MKGMQKQAKLSRASGQVGGVDLPATGFEVQPVQVLIGTVAFIVSVVLLHFYSKITA